MSTLVRTLTVAAAVGAAVNAGVFFAFSTFTMDGLRRLAPSDGARAMQRINEEAPKPPLMLLMFGTAAVCVVLGVRAVGGLGEQAAVMQLVGVGLFLLTVIVTTGVYHVPRNNALAAVDPASPAGVEYWSLYLREWVRMNHVRTVGPLVSAVLLATSLRLDETSALA